MTQYQEGREYQQMIEVWSLWQMLLKKIVVQYVKNFLESREFHILTNLNKKTISARWVSIYLTAEQKQKYLNIATLLKERFDVEHQAFLRRIFAIEKRGLGTLSRS